jgi:hypothetical protein
MTQDPDPRARTDEIDTAERLGGGATLDPTAKPHPDSLGGGVQDPLGAKVERLAAEAGLDRVRERPDANIPIGFQDARRLVEAAQRSTWGKGSYMVADWGREDATHWLIISGAHEWLVGGDDAYRESPGVAALVDKHTGEIDWVAYLPNSDRIDAMRPVGDEPGRPLSEV